jgi:hypothetical protein
MAFFSSLFSRPAAPAATPAPVQFEVPAALPRLGGASAGEIAARAGQRENLPPAGTTPASHVGTLLQQRKPMEAVAFLAHALPPRDSVRWATQACALVAGQQTPADRQAAEAARLWSAQPTEENRQRALAGATEAGHAGPGAWAAQGAAWAGAAPTPGAPPPADLTGKAVAGAVMLAAAMTRPGVQLPPVAKPAAPNAPTLAAPALPALPQLAVPPPAAPALDTAAEAEQLCRVYKPFVDSGLAIAAGTA